ncbi:efflux RND transporter periplasmic adaptor subunit [Eisenbergiella sp.]
MAKLKLKWIKEKKVPLLVVFALCLVLAAGLSIGLWLSSEKGEEVSYREVQAEYGELTVGLEESGSVTVGTTEQTFDLDLSAYTESNSDGFSWGQGGSIFQGMGGQSGSGSSGSSGTRKLIIEEVLITEGQEIAQGDALYRITEESMDSIREELSSDVSDAEVTLAKTQTQKQLTELEAKQAYETNVAYGALADAEYQNSVQDLQDAAAEMEEQITQLQEELAELNTQLAEYQADLEMEKKVLENGEYVVSTTDMVSDAYGWITAENAREEAAQVVESLEESMEDTTDTIAEKQKELEALEKSLTGAQRDLELGIIEAQAQLEKRNLKYKNAEETYNVSVELSSFEAKNAQEDYEDAAAKLNEFDSYLADRTIRAENNGVVTECPLEAGDTVNTGSSLVVINDYDEVTVPVSVEESELSNIKEGDAVNIYIASYPEEDFTGTVDSIGDSTYNSSTGTTYVEITVKLGGENSRLYEGMSAQVTFITKETETVVYVSNRAVSRENGKSYVKKKEADGSITLQEVTTGFSDGINVEIKEGLSEGDTVLIESKVSDS